MKYILFTFLFFIFPLSLFAQTLDIPYTIASEAVLYGVDPKVALYISSLESDWNPSAIGDHGLAVGLAQIRLDYHPEITREQALNPLFSIHFLIENLAKGNCHWWSTCPLI